MGLSLNSSMTIGKSFNFAALIFPTCKIRPTMPTLPNSRGCYEHEMKEWVGIHFEMPTKGSRETHFL